MSLLDCIAPKPGTGAGSDIVQRVLQSVRQHLGMEVAYVSEFVGNTSIFRTVDAPGLEAMIKPGDSRSVDDVYCLHILAGTLPELMPDTADFPLAAAMPITRAVPIGAHVSVPLRLSDGQVYGMFCCLSPSSNKTLNQRDLQVMRSFAAIAAGQIDKDRSATRDSTKRRDRVARIILDRQFSTCFQPIWEFQHDKLVGFECLSRFDAVPARPPDKWFAEATGVGLGSDLELAAIAAALTLSYELPDSLYVTVNASAEAVLHEAFETTIRAFPLHRLVLELTEHTAVQDYHALDRALGGLRRQGMRLAIDDAGAGYSGLQQIVALRPDIIKLDIGLTRDVDSDPARRALASALVHYALETHCQILAEGIETAAELATLKQLGIGKGQGYLLGRPLTFAGVLELLAAASGPMVKASEPA
jgi:EAL domain-containing protein (putative c-di-GMP-specific phosphodiesterase class I)